MDTFIQFKEGGAHPYMHQWSKSQDPQHEAKFSKTVVISALSGPYICFDSESSLPYLMSHYRFSMEILVSGEVIQTYVSSEGNPV